MAVGGTWETQDKIRPGAYINFAYEKPAQRTASDRGVVAIAVPMTWGEEGTLIEVQSGDLYTSKDAVRAIGCTYNEAESLPFRLALASASKALVYRADTGGAKAIATEGTSPSVALLAAKHAGTTGNKLSVSISKQAPGSTRSNVIVAYTSATSVITLESFVVDNFPLGLAAVKSNFVEFADATELANLDGAYDGGVYTLSGGTNGQVASSATGFTTAIQYKRWNTIASMVPGFTDSLYDFVVNLRYNEGRATQLVFHSDTPPNKVANCIVTSQGFRSEEETVSPELFPLYVASISAGADVNESNTGIVVPGAVEIINPYQNEEILTRLMRNEFLLSYRQDGAVVVERDVNVGETDEGGITTKNRVLRCVNEINNTVSLMFNRDFLGKISNNAEGLNTFKSAVIAYVDSLQSKGAVQNFDSSEDVTVMPGEDIDSILVTLAVQPVDSVEKLYMTVDVSA